MRPSISVSIRTEASSPGGRPPPAGAKVIDTAPAVAWMGYGIHGDELSSCDAALELAYQLLAGTDEDTQRIRDNVITIIDPLQNPDGHERWLGMLEQYNSVVPSSDIQSMHHTGVWPAGRTIGEVPLEEWVGPGAIADISHLVSDASVYTPQMIVNGQDSIVGARAMELADLIQAHKGRDMGVSLEVSRNNGVVTIRAQNLGGHDEMVVHMLRYMRDRKVEITFASSQ